MGYRRRARQIALQVLYQIDIAKTAPLEALNLYWQCFEAPKSARSFASELVLGVHEHLTDIDRFIMKCSENWSLRRMAKVDRNILRLATYELIYCPDIPPKVTLNEAIDLGKEFGSENSSSFVNGILDALYAQLRTEINGGNGNIGIDRQPAS